MELEIALEYHRAPRAIGGAYRVFESDETRVNKKRNPLAICPRCAIVLIFSNFSISGHRSGEVGIDPDRNARRRTHRWFWGIVDSSGNTRHYMRLLPPPAEEEGGAPRGAPGLAISLRAAGLLPDSLVVGDDWVGYNREGWLLEFGRAEPHHPNRRDGEIVNAVRFTTNHAANLCSQVRERAGVGHIAFSEFTNLYILYAPRPRTPPKAVGLKDGRDAKRAG